MLSIRALTHGPVYLVTNETFSRWLVLFVYTISSFASLPALTVAGETLSEKLKRPSITVNVVVAVLVLPEESVAVMVIVCVPIPTTVPASGLCVSISGPQLSLAIVATSTLGITAWPLRFAVTLAGGGAVIVGAVLSMTVTV